MLYYSLLKQKCQTFEHFLRTAKCLRYGSFLVLLYAHCSSVFLGFRFKLKALLRQSEPKDIIMEKAINEQ